MGDKYVTITDNGQPRMHVLVYSRDNGELVCSEPVFQPGRASNENSLIATDKSIIVENNFGYKELRRIRPMGGPPNRALPASMSKTVPVIRSGRTNR